MATQYNFEASIEKTKLILKICGININKKYSSKGDRRKLRLIFIFNFLWLYSDIGGAFYLFCKGVLEAKGFTHLTFIAPCVTFGMLSGCKILTLVFSEDAIFNLLADIRDIEKRSNVELSTEKQMVVRKDVELLHRVLKYFDILNGLLLLTFSSSAMVIITINYMKTGELKLELPFFVAYPFDAFTLTRWPFVYLHQIWSEVIVLIYVMAADYLFYICSTYIKVHFELLQQDFQDLIPRVGVRGSVRVDQLNSRLEDLVKRHQLLIRSVDSLEFVYGKSTLFNFLTSSMIICLTGFNVTTLFDVTLVITFISFLSLGLLQIFFLCFYGDMIMKSSMEISDAVYNSQWYKANSKLMKTLCIIQMRAQKPCKLTAFRFADVNCRAFMRILSNSWTYFALLKTIYSSPKRN